MLTKTLGAAASRQKITYMTSTALFAALICITTAYICHIPFGLNGAYIHVGDALIYLAASILPAPYAMAAGALGGVFADLFTAPVWAPATLLVKMAIAIPFTSKKNKIITVQNVVGVFLAALISIAGYCVAEYVLFGSWAGAMASVISSTIQATGSGVLFIVFGFALDKVHFKANLKNRFHL